MLALDAAGHLRAALVAVVGGRGRGFGDPPPGRLLALEVERVLRVTAQAVALGLADAGRVASWLAAPSPDQRRWLRDALGWSSAPAPPMPSPLPAPALALAAAAATAAAAAVMCKVWSGDRVPRRDSTNGAGRNRGFDGGTAAAAALLAAAAILVVAGGARALPRRA
jgi:hypothetical protein